VAMPSSSPENLNQPFSQLSLSLEIPRASLKYDKNNPNALLGKGSFGAVYVGTWQDHTSVAVKELFIQQVDDNVLSEFKNEMQIMANLRHPNIVLLYGVCTQVSPYCIVMEWMQKGSLYGVLKNSDQDLPWSLRQTIAFGISSGLAHLHAHQPPILHRDLKSLNVLLDKHFNAKLADFGLAKFRSESASSSKGSVVGTVLWMAPELFRRGGKASSASDIYSLGVVLWEIASRKLPFADADNIDIIPTWIKDGEREPIPDGTPSFFSQLLTECWDGEPSKRPSAAQVVQRLQ